MHLIKLKHFQKFGFERTDRHDIHKISSAAFTNYNISNWEMNNYYEAYINPEYIISISDIKERYLSNDDNTNGRWVYAFYIEMFNGDVYWVRCDKRKYNQIDSFIYSDNINESNVVKKKQHL